MDEDSSGKGNDDINDKCAKPGDAMRCDVSSNEYPDRSVSKPSFKDMVAEGNGVKCPPSAAFECSVGEGDHGHRGSNTDGLGSPINISGGIGKAPLLLENTLSLTPNVDMVNAIKGEQSRLKSIEFSLFAWMSSFFSLVNIWMIGLIMFGARSSALLLILVE